MAQLYRVLMIEDDPDDIEIVSSTLELATNMSFDLTAVSRLDEGIEFLSRNDPDFVLLDLNLPDSNGLDTLRRLRAHSPESLLVVISGLMADDDLVMDMLRLGAQEYLYKGDITDRNLALVMRHALERSRQRAALQESEARLRQVVEASADGMMVVDGEGVVRFANPAAQALFEREDSELVGQPFGLPLVAGDSGADIEVRRRSGEMRFVDMRLVELVWENEPAFLATLRDVSDRKRRETELAIIAGVSAALREGWSSAEIMEIVLDQIMVLLHTDGALFATLDDADNLVEGPGRQVGAVRHEALERLTRRVLITGQPYNGREPQVDPLFALHSQSGQLHNEICTPLVSSEATLGALWITRQRPFTAADVRLLNTIADIAAGAIHRATMLAEAKENLHRLNILHQLDLQITAKQSLRHILAVAMQNVSTMWAIDAAAVTLRVPRSSRLHTIAHWGMHTNPAQENPEGVICAWIDKCIEDKRLIFLPDITQCDPPLRRQYLIDKEHARAYYVAPLTVDGEVIGVFELLWRNAIRLTPNATDFLRTLSSQIAIAVEQDRLHLKTDQLLLQTRIQAQQLQEIIDNVAAGIILLDGDCRTLLANPMGQTYLEQLTGKPYAKNTPIKTLAQHSFRSILRAVGAGGMAVELPLMDESNTLFEIDIKRIEAFTGIGQYVLFVRDVSQQRDLQAKMHQQERLASVGQMAAGIAHDFNNVLGAIILQSHLLLSTDQVQPQSRQRVTTIVEQADHATRLIRQILDFSRRSMLERKTSDMRVLLHRAVALLETTLPATIQLNLQIVPGAYTVDVDETSFQQALMNLVFNARDAIDGEGSISLHLSSLVLDGHTKRPVYGMVDGSWLRLTVADTGMGMSPEIQAQVFDPFFTTKPAGKGTGLGLSQVYGIIKQHNGEIALESKPGKGTTFIIYLPLSSTAEAATIDDDTPIAGHGESVLVVEDNEAMRGALENMLDALGYRVRAAASGIEALAIPHAQLGRLDLLLTDLVMPEMGGIDLYRSIKQIKPTIKALVISGYPMDEAGQAFLDQGAIDWLPKPFSVVDLAKKIRTVLDT
ncbi:MAG: response regulator [Caldilineaceae bacterium]|nr:response regulator [Caldilineaceae bacterium]